MNIHAPDCSEPDDALYPNNINAMLRDIKRYRRQVLDPEGYLKDLLDAQQRAHNKQIKGSKEGGKKE